MIGIWWLDAAPPPTYNLNIFQFNSISGGDDDAFNVYLCVVNICVYKGQAMEKGKFSELKMGMYKLKNKGDSSEHRDRKTLMGDEALIKYRYLIEKF